ncbi:MAG: hypothetical protein DMF78_24470 [Acidobacteria bacterium]|nr:MAG: hypothetical protein DMF78_24470 [Acidobacteriota bacterium]
MRKAMSTIRRAAAALLVLCAAGAQAASLDPALSTRLRRIETAFRGGDAASLRPIFTGNGKVRVDLKDVMDGPGSYGPSQLEVIFGRIFDENRTREFHFRDDEVTVSTPGTAFARGRWVRKARPGGTDATDTLTFTLRQESGDWRIHEIRSSR